MFALTFSYFVASFSAGAAQTIEEYSETMFCSEELRGPGSRPTIIATLEVDRAHRPLRHSILLLGREYRANWLYPSGRFQPDEPLGGLEISSLALQAGARFPVTATMRFDGRTVWAGETARAKHTVVTLQGASTAWSGQPGISIKVGLGGVPTLFGVGQAEIVVTAADGTEVARQFLALPDWTILEAQLPDVFDRLEAQRSAGSCRPTVRVTIID